MSFFRWLGWIAIILINAAALFIVPEAWVWMGFCQLVYYSWFYYICLWVEKSPSNVPEKGIERKVFTRNPCGCFKETAQ